MDEFEQEVGQALQAANIELSDADVIKVARIVESVLDSRRLQALHSTM